jgi:hypothetical protein
MKDRDDRDAEKALKRFLKFLRRVFCLPPANEAVTLDPLVGPAELKGPDTKARPAQPRTARIIPSKEGRPMIAVLLTNEQKRTVTLRPKTAGGHPARVDGVPTWTAEDTAAVTLEPSADGMSCVFTSPDGEARTKVQAKADADLGTGTREVTEDFDVITTLAEASSLGAEVGEPEPK